MAGLAWRGQARYGRTPGGGGPGMIVRPAGVAWRGKPRRYVLHAPFRKL